MMKVLVFVDPQKSDQWWPHRGFSIADAGTWQGKALIGDKPCVAANHHFEIVALAMTRDQANQIATDFQPLPTEYVARSNFVDLVTTYAPVQIDLSRAISSSAPNTSNSINLSTGQTSLEIDYNLTDEWVQVKIPMSQENPSDLSCMQELGFSVSFSLQGMGEANSLEVKLEDIDYTNYGWRGAGRSVTTGPEMVELPLDDFDFWWDDGKDLDMNWGQVMHIMFAISKHPGDAGGAGRVIISDVTLNLTGTPSEE
jgi:hypothetical protein